MGKYNLLEGGILANRNNVATSKQSKPDHQ